jgi:pimeloyl-ACP methyl ester carboxylesterase
VSPPWPKRPLRVIANVVKILIDIVRLIISTLAYVVTWVFLVLVGVVLTPILPLLSPLLLIPWFKDIAQGVLDGLVESIGDVASWKERPVRASAMRLVVRDALARAKQLVGDGDVHLFAHSQGAAVATYTLFEELEPSEFNVRRLTTVGAAVVLLGREKWQGREDSYTPVQTWIDRNRDLASEDRIAWENHWAIWDPFSAGPIADTSKAARKRWRAAYFPTPNTIALGPEEHAVHNTSQPFLDHGMYFANTVQVVEPTARHLLGPDFPPAPAPVEYIRNRLVVIDKKSLGLSTIAALVIAAITPGLPLASVFFAGVVTSVASAIGVVIAFFTAAEAREGAEAARGSVSFLIEGDRLSALGWVVASALLLALLVWLNQLMQKQTERSIVWDRCPLEVRTWLVLTAIPRALYVVTAAVVVGFAIRSWSNPTPSTADMAIWVTVLTVVTVFVILEPRFAPAPVIVPSRETLDDAPTVHAPAQPMRLGLAIASEEYQRDLATRRENLAPKGPWAVSWAYCFHGWRPQKPASH